MTFSRVLCRGFICLFLLLNSVFAETSDERTVRLGQEAARELGGLLKQELSKALASGGPASAMKFCSEQAFALTAATQKKLGIEVSRVSARNRSPGNSPDTIDQRALELFEKKLTDSTALPPYLLVRDDKAMKRRFYKPIQMEAVCLSCHGPKEQLDAETRRLLDLHYPQDKATGYKLGELRGAIKVVVPD